MQLWTQKGKKEWIESEPGAPSDIKSGKAEVRVRTWCNFGHKKGKRRG
ncbi:hypothetical protein KIS4809_3043 [Bacillus sp. ZZV12-4809]|nr:hypothetical protein KIS4809_3043 [Bacillus sp. ZZV12-4809]